VLTVFAPLVIITILTQTNNVLLTVIVRPVSLAFLVFAKRTKTIRITTIITTMMTTVKGEMMGSLETVATVLAIAAMDCA
jgi:hypothetical protein